MQYFSVKLLAEDYTDFL